MNLFIIFNLFLNAVKTSKIFELLNLLERIEEKEKPLEKLG